MMPIGFIINGGGLMLFYFIDDPKTFISFFIWGLTSLTFIFEVLAIENFFSKNVPKEVRGLMYGILYFIA